MRDEFQALRFAATEGGARLAEAEIIESRIAERLERTPNAGKGGEKLGRFRHAHGQDFGNVPAVQLDLERLAIVPRPATALARDKSGRQKAHLQFGHAAAF